MTTLRKGPPAAGRSQARAEGRAPRGKTTRHEAAHNTPNGVCGRDIAQAEDAKGHERGGDPGFNKDEK